MKQLVILCCIISGFTFGQDPVLLIGNTKKLCYIDEFTIDETAILPRDLSSYKAIYIFSNSTSQLTQTDIQRIITFVENGGGLYTGSENNIFYRIIMNGE